MATNPTQTPDLQSILASLAQFATLPINNVADAGITDVAPSQEAGGDSALHSDSSMPTSWPPPAVLEKAQDPRLMRPQSRTATASPKPMIDPATITVWQEGLRCVTKIAAQNVQFAACIRKMIASQQTNEMRWYAERQALKQTQAARATSAARALSILKSLNSKPVEEAPVDIEGDAAAELARFDQKIYAAQQAMDQAMTAELKGLGVPFFGTDVNLVVPDGHDLSKEPQPETQPKWSRIVTESEVLALRRRMVGHLEDMYKD